MFVSNETQSTEPALGPGATISRGIPALNPRTENS